MNPQNTATGATPDVKQPAPALPAVTGASSLPALPPAGGAVAPVPLPRSIIMRLPVALGPALEILTRRLPIIAGQTVDDYLKLLEIAVAEWLPQTLQECSLVKQLVDAEWEIIALQQVQTCLLNWAIGAELLAILAAEEKDNGQEEPLGRAQAMKNVIFAALAGHPAALDYVERRTGRKVGIGPDTAVHFASEMPVHLFADRAINTRLGRRDAAYRELARIQAAHSGRMAGKDIDLADIRKDLSFPEYLRALIEIDLTKQAEPEAYLEQLQQAVKERKGEAAHAAEPPLSPGEEMLRKLKNMAQPSAAVAETSAAHISVHCPVELKNAPSAPANSDDVAG
jgi:hypothetical protein